MRFLLFWLLLAVMYGPTGNFSTLQGAAYIALSFLFLAWDMWDTFRPQPTIVMQQPMEPLVHKVTELLKMRTHCANTNDCEACKGFLETFIEPHPGQEPEVAVPGVAGVPPDNPGLYL